MYNIKQQTKINGNFDYKKGKKLKIINQIKK